MFGQLIIGPPGSGKSTYAYGMYQFLNAIGRKVSVINMDPANDHVQYPCALDIRDFVQLEEVMTEQNLGPNGGIMYALEEVEESLDGFVNKVKELGDNEYLLFDCPGQVELFTHHGALQRIFKRLEKQEKARLCVVNLVDSHYITKPSLYVSVLLLTLRSMLQLDLPQVNVLSKIDLIHRYGTLDFNLDYYTEVQDLHHLFPLLEKEAGMTKYAKLTEAIAEVVEDFGLVAFEVLAVEDKKSMIQLLTTIDKATGYLFGSTEVGGDSFWAEATRQGGYVGGVSDIQERWIDYKDEYDEEARKEHEEKLKEAEEATRPLTEEEEWEQALQDYEEGMGGPAIKRETKE